MEKNYIYKHDLGEILEEIADEALKHADKLTAHIIIKKGSMSVTVVGNEPPYTTLSAVAYDIIDKLEDTDNALDHIFGDALVELDRLSIRTKESNNI